MKHSRDSWLHIVIQISLKQALHIIQWQFISDMHLKTYWNTASNVKFYLTDSFFFITLAVYLGRKWCQRKFRFIKNRIGNRQRILGVTFLFGTCVSLAKRKSTMIVIIISWNTPRVENKLEMQGWYDETIA